MWLLIALRIPAAKRLLVKEFRLLEADERFHLRQPVIKNKRGCLRQPLSTMQD